MPLLWVVTVSLFQNLWYPLCCNIYVYVVYKMCVCVYSQWNFFRSLYFILLFKHFYLNTIDTWSYISFMCTTWWFNFCMWYAVCTPQCSYHLSPNTTITVSSILFPVLCFLFSWLTHSPKACISLSPPPIFFFPSTSHLLSGNHVSNLFSIFIGLILGFVCLFIRLAFKVVYMSGIKWDFFLSLTYFISA